jgi:hypothetical protein
MYHPGHMFIGHFALGLAAKRVTPRVSLGVLFAAAQLADLVWPVLLFTGAERVRVTPTNNPFLRLSFEWYPWTHSLLTEVVWGALAGWLLPLFAWWVDRHRRATTRTGESDVTRAA